MIYINPFDLIEQKTKMPILLDTKNLQKAKRKLMVEFELNPDSSIDYYGNKLSKDDIIKILDEVNEFYRGKLHFWVYEDKFLSKFLNTGDPEYFRKFEPKFFHTDDDFLLLIRRYYIRQFNTSFIEKYRNNRFEDIRAMVKNNIFSSEKDLMKCYAETLNYTNKLAGNITAILKEAQNTSLPQTPDFIKIEKIALEAINTTSINILPNTFREIKEEIAKSLAEIAIICFQKFKKKELAKKIINKANKIDIDSQKIKNHIQEYLIRIETEAKTENSKKESDFQFPFTPEKLKEFVKKYPDIYQNEFLKKHIKKYLPDFYKELYNDEN